MFNPFSPSDIERQMYGFKSTVNQLVSDVANNQELYMYAYGFLLDPLTKHPVYTVSTCSGGNDDYSLKITLTQPVYDSEKQMWEIVKKCKVNGKVFQYYGKGLSLEEAMNRLQSDHKTFEVKNIDPVIQDPVNTLLNDYEVELHIVYYDELKDRYKLEISNNTDTYYDKIIVPITQEDIAFSTVFYGNLESGSAYSPQAVAYAAVCNFLQVHSNFINNPPSDLVFQVQRSVKIENYGLDEKGLKFIIRATLELTPDLLVIYKSPNTNFFKNFTTKWTLIEN